MINVICENIHFAHENMCAQSSGVIHVGDNLHNEYIKTASHSKGF